MNLGRTSRTLAWLSVGIALAVFLLPPLAYVLVQHEGLSRSLEHDARVQATLISEVVGRNSQIWPHAHERLVEGIADVRVEGRQTRLFEESGKLIVDLPADLDWPILTRSDTFFESGARAGRVEVSGSLSSVLVNASWALLACGLVALAIIGPLWRMPQRALQRASESLLRGELSRSLVEGLSVGVVLSDFQHRILGANEVARELFAALNRRGADAIADILRDACHEDGTAVQQADWPMQRCIDTRQPAGPLVIGLQDHAEGLRWLSVKSTPVRHGESGEYDAVVSSVEDVTDSKLDADRLNVIQHAVMAAPDSVLITDAESRILMVNEAFNHLTGYTTDEVLGKTPAVLRSSRHPDEFYAAIWQAIRTEGKWSGEVWNRKRDGDIYPAWLSISAVTDLHGRVGHYIGTHFDLTERVEAEQRIRHLALHDSLTGLPNRSSLRETLANELVRAQRHGWRVALFFIDLDRFKIVNDTLGHHVGDNVLMEVARRLKQAMRAEDTVGRLSGDEFIAIATVMTSDAAELTMANHLVEAMTRPIALEDREIDLTVSVGVAMFPDDGHDVDTLLRSSDTAMYAAKSDGRSNFKFFAESMRASGASRLETYRAVREALAGQQFQLFFQPQVWSGAGFSVCGAEALIRWNHPERGLVMPGEFIPVIEETRLIIDVGDWVLEEALRQARALQARGCPVSISVNVSALQVRQDSFVSKLTRLARRYADTVPLIRLEVTEGLMLGEQQQTLASLQAVRALGFRLALDDFGTGYSSLAYLARYPFDEIKIDRTFVSRLDDDATARAIAEAIILLGRSLGLNVVAEGVETERQSAVLRGLGCPAIQGYLYGRPMAFDVFAQRLIG